MWQQIVVGVLVLGAAAYAGWALWPKKSKGGACCDASGATTSTPSGSVAAREGAAKEKAPRPCGRGA